MLSGGAVAPGRATALPSEVATLIEGIGPSGPSSHVSWSSSTNAGVIWIFRPGVERALQPWGSNCENGGLVWRKAMAVARLQYRIYGLIPIYRALSRALYRHA
jgi:hypothetical protein